LTGRRQGRPDHGPSAGRKAEAPLAKLASEGADIAPTAQRLRRYGICRSTRPCSPNLLGEATGVKRLAERGLAARVVASARLPGAVDGVVDALLRPRRRWSA